MPRPRSEHWRRLCCSSPARRRARQLSGPRGPCACALQATTVTDALYIRACLIRAAPGDLARTTPDACRMKQEQCLKQTWAVHDKQLRPSCRHAACAASRSRRRWRRCSRCAACGRPRAARMRRCACCRSACRCWRPRRRPPRRACGPRCRRAWRWRASSCRTPTCACCGRRGRRGASRDGHVVACVCTACVI